MKQRILLLLLAGILCIACIACERQPEQPEFPDSPASPGGTTGSVTPDSIPFAGSAIEGSSLSWEIYADGTLYIKGTGEMPEIESGTVEDSDLPWNAHRKGNIDTALTIKKIIIEEGVTSITPGAFESCADLTEVTLPASLRVIPYRAFANCHKLTRVGGGVGVERIEENAFQNCGSLRTVSLSTPLQVVELGAFHGCTELTVYFTGSEAEWESTSAALSVAGSNDAFTGATVRCFAK